MAGRAGHRLGLQVDGEVVSGKAAWHSRLNGPADATGIAFGQTLPGAIGSRAETDAFVFSAAANDRVLVRMTNAGPGGVGPQARIFNAAGTLVPGCSGFAANQLEFQCSLPATGSYALIVQDNLGDQTGGYFLHLGIICTITGTAGDDVLNGGAGRDVICPLGGNDTVNGAGGNDVIVTEATTDGADVFNGGSGNDLVTYGSRTGAVSVDLDNVADDGAVGEGDNVRTEVENIAGGLGNDTLVGRAGVTLLHGGQGNDTLRGLGGNDLLNGQGNNDTVVGGGGNDTMKGDAGDDTLTGGSGDDFMDGGGEVDTCNGGGHVTGDTAVNCETTTGVP